MTFTDSKVVPHIITAYLTMIVLTLVVCSLQGCAQPQPAVKTRIVTPSSQAETQEPPKPPPASTTPAEDTTPKEDAPFFGSTYWDELLTSVYYYPKSVSLPSMTHLKFGHREDDIWLCGDQRKTFEPGNRVRLLATFEPNQPCVTNWKVK